MQDIEINIEMDIEKCSLELMKKPLLRKASWKLVDTSMLLRVYILLMSVYACYFNP